MSLCLCGYGCPLTHSWFPKSPHCEALCHVTPPGSWKLDAGVQGYKTKLGLISIGVRLQDQGVEAKGQELLQQGLRGTWQYFSETSAMNKLPPFLMYTRYHDDHLDSPVTGQQDGGTRIQRAAAQKLSDQRLRRKFCSNGEDSQDDD